MSTKLKITVMGQKEQFWTADRIEKFSQEAFVLLNTKGLGEDINELRVSERCSQNTAGKQVCKVYLCYKSKFLFTPMEAVFDEDDCLEDIYAVNEE